MTHELCQKIDEFLANRKPSESLNLLPFKDYLSEFNLSDEKVEMILKYLPIFDSIGLLGEPGDWSDKEICLQYYGKCPYPEGGDVFGWPLITATLFFTGEVRIDLFDWESNYELVFIPEWFNQLNCPHTTTWDSFIINLKEIVISIKENGEKDLKDPDFISKITEIKDFATKQINELQPKIDRESRKVEVISRLLLAKHEWFM